MLWRRVTYFIQKTCWRCWQELEEWMAPGAGKPQEGWLDTLLAVKNSLPLKCLCNMSGFWQTSFRDESFTVSYVIMMSYWSTTAECCTIGTDFQNSSFFFSKTSRSPAVGALVTLVVLPCFELSSWRDSLVMDWVCTCFGVTKICCYTVQLHFLTIHVLKSCLGFL